MYRNVAHCISNQQSLTTGKVRTFLYTSIEGDHLKACPSFNFRVAWGMFDSNVLVLFEYSLS